MRKRPILAAAALVLVAAACQKPPAAPTAAPAGERVGNVELGVAIAALPSFFRVAANEGPRLELAPADPAISGRLEIVATEPAVGGVNLVAAVEDHRREILARPQAEYQGQRELGSHLGTAFYSRGRYQAADGASEEETTIFLVHPRGDRRLDLRYRYPAADDTRERIEEQLFAVLGELEPLAGDGETGGDGG